MNNFTPRAQQTLALARREADRLHHDLVDTEHLLLGMLRLGQGVGINTLQRMSIDLEAIRLGVEKLITAAPEKKTVGNIPYSMNSKKVLALAGKEAKALNHSYVGTEHLLLGMLREGEGIAAQVLRKMNVDIERARNEVLKELDPNFEPGRAGNPPQVPPPSRALAAPYRFAAYKAVRDEIAHEDTLMGTRFNWFIAAQAFLLSALAIAHAPATASMPSVRNDFYFPLIPLLAIASCLLILLSIVGGAVAIRRWRRQLGEMLRQDAALPAIGDDEWIMRAGWVAPVLLPIIFCGAWAYLLIVGYRL